MAGAADRVCELCTPVNPAFHSDVLPFRHKYLREGQKFLPVHLFTSKEPLVTTSFYYPLPCTLPLPTPIPLFTITLYLVNLN